MPFRSLQSRLLSLTLGPVVVSGLIFAWLTFSSARAGLEQAIGRQLADKARETAELLNAEVESAELALRALIAQDLMRELLIGDIDKRISGALLATRRTSPAYRDLLCSNSEGRLVAATNPEHLANSLPPIEAPSRPNEIRVEGPLPGPDGSPVLRLSAVVADPDAAQSVIGVCTLLYDWQATQSLAERMRESLARVGEEVDIVLLDRTRTVIGGAWDGSGYGRSGGGTKPFPVPVPHDGGFAYEPALDALVGVAEIEAGTSRWTVLAVQPAREAFAPIASMQRRWASTLAVILLVTAAVGILLARRLIRPLLALTEATRSLARTGEPSPPVPVESTDEIGELAASFNSMTTKLKRAQEQLLHAAKFAFVGEVAAGIAHEVRTPLGVIKTSAQVLQRSLQDPSERTRELFALIVEEVNRLDRVVTGLLELARPRQPTPTRTAIDAVARRAVEFLAPEAREHGVSLCFEGESVHAWCDGEQIYQVLLNLAMNAIQVMHGGGRITIRSRREDVARVAIEIADDGPGIDPSIQAQIFTPFFTLRNGGTGLGLSLVDQIVRAHRGVVSVSSEPGRGATFTVWLPVEREET